MFGHTHIPFRQFPRLFPVVTALFSVQAVFFLIMTFLGGTQYIPNLIRFGALEPLLVSYGEWWRLVVPIFIHIGLFHFLFNSFALYLFGPQLEWLFGRISFLFLYLFSGFVGNLMTYWYMIWFGQTGVSRGVGIDLRPDGGLSVSHHPPGHRAGSEQGIVGHDRDQRSHQHPGSADQFDRPSGRIGHGFSPHRDSASPETMRKGSLRGWHETGTVKMVPVGYANPW
ncbi:rhomboid family protein [Planifilum fimeticola]|uniref:Rhomboid family protein n=1 Tax=Planifilum fimeticola TaxID=201975 RepID=A0A2T0LJA0_9BACL|nr:rhomboid family intramembrane serine protease [Planifilum fimeticola]PRX42596.1 rhomboid family protein [Planifilum fimeticola]